jgi:hypothetical protein
LGFSPSAFQGEIGWLFAGQPAVGNSRLADMDVLSVSWKQPADLSPWHSVFHEQGLHLKGAILQTRDTSSNPRHIFKPALKYLPQTHGLLTNTLDYCTLEFTCR